MFTCLGAVLQDQPSVLFKSVSAGGFDHKLGIEDKSGLKSHWRSAVTRSADSPRMALLINSVHHHLNFSHLSVLALRGVRGGGGASARTAFVSVIS